ncbi:MAG: Tim44/TimA family putative adaptor protein [Rhizobiaceae bacterium]
MQFLDFGTIFFLVAAVVVFLQLRNVLGKRTGNERPPFDPYAGSRREKVDGEKPGGNVITLSKRKPDGEKDYSSIDSIVPPGSEANNGLRALKDSDPSFDPAEFLNGAKMAYEMIVTAFADGDRKTLKNLLSKEVNDGFVTAISEREMRGEKVHSNFVGISKMEVSDADVKGSEAQITLKIESQLISATLDKDDNVIDGSKENVSDVKDVWTFARDTRSRDPNWKLIATEAEE